jgi:putative membrane protein
MTKGLLLSMGLMSMFAFAAKMDPAELLSRIHDTNREEIQLGILAKSKARNLQVREYGERLVKDHTEAENQVQAMEKTKVSDCRRRSR